MNTEWWPKFAPSGFRTATLISKSSWQQQRHLMLNHKECKIVYKYCL